MHGMSFPGVSLTRASHSSRRDRPRTGRHDESHRREPKYGDAEHIASDKYRRRRPQTLWHETTPFPRV